MDIGNSISELYTVIAGEGSSGVTNLSEFSSLSLSDMLLVTGGGSGTSFVPLSLSDPLLDLGSLSLSLFLLFSFCWCFVL